MWSHYADSHKGICIEYEYHVDETSGYKINYQQPKNMGCKQECWEYENEFGMITKYIQKDVDLQGVDIAYREIGLKIKGIFCGVKFEENQLETLKVIRGRRPFEMFTGEVENYNSIKFTKTGAVERT